MNIFAFSETNSDQPSYPALVSINRNEDGSVTVSVRETPTVRDGCFVCVFAADKGQPGRCTPGDQHCNNYCNKAPQKGAMADSPADCLQVFEGRHVAVTIPSELWHLS